jgi:ankyrin repeat protein
MSLSDEINEQFRDCVGKLTFYNNNNILFDQVMSVMISDVSNDIDVSYKWGHSKWNIIMMVSWYNKIELLKLVLSKYEADVSKLINECDCYGYTAIMLATMRGYYDIVELLSLYDANVNIQNKYKFTALHYASKHGHTRIVELLLSKGALVDIQNDESSTPLHLACSSGHFIIAKELIRRGSNLSIINRNGQSPLDYIVNESDKILLKVQEEMFRKWENSTSFVIVLRHFNISVDKSKEGTNRTVFNFRLKNIDYHENNNQQAMDQRRTRPREVIGCVFENIHVCQIICNYL